MTAPNDAAMDAMLAAMLAPPRRAGDRAFTLQVERAIDAQAAYARARARFWRSFAFEALAIAERSNQALHEDSNQLHAQLSQVSANLGAVYASRSWRITRTGSRCTRSRNSPKRVLASLAV